MNAVLENMKTRASVRSFKPELIKDEELNAIVEAGLLAPSGMNKQDRKSVV